MIITLTTDFGLADPYVGIMKGVILGIAPEARLIDVSHAVASYDVMEGALVLLSAVRYFPAGTVHLGVVDPGVGSRRRPIAASDGRHMFVGPDNGLFSLCLGDDAELHHITNEEYFLTPVSDTFHGRDIFAPVAARLAMGAALESVGPRVYDFLRLIIPSGPPTILHVDRFGNLVTSLRPEDLGADSVIRIAGHDVGARRAAYAEGASGELFLIAGSSGYLEISMNRASAADHLKVRRGMELNVETVRQKQ